MAMTLRAFLGALLLLQAATTQRVDASMANDVDRLLQAAQQLKETWPSQPPPPIPEAALVA